LPWKPHCKGAPDTSELCSNIGHDRCLKLPAFFNYCYGQSFVHLSTFWCHPTTFCENKEIIIKWGLLNSFCGYSEKGLNRIRLTWYNRVWILCQRMFTHSYFRVLLQIYPTLHCQCFFQTCFQWFRGVWVLFEHLNSLIMLFFRCSHQLIFTSLMWIVCIWVCDLHSFFVSQAQWVGVPSVFHPYLMQTASLKLNSCLVSAYQILQLWLALLKAKKTFLLCHCSFCGLLCLRGHFPKKCVIHSGCVFAYSNISNSVHQ